MNQITFSIPHKFATPENTLDRKSQFIFEGIPTKEDVETLLALPPIENSYGEQRKIDKFVIPVTDAFTLTIWYSARTNTYGINHECSRQDGHCHEAIQNPVNHRYYWETYESLVEHVKRMINVEILFTMQRIERLKRIVS